MAPIQSCLAFATFATFATAFQPFVGDRIMARSAATRNNDVRMAVPIGINGFGRIGRLVARIAVS